MKLSVLIPAYNESKNIEATIHELFLVLSKIPAIIESEVIVVDDHSSDGTYNVVEKLKDQRVKCIRLNRRCGSHTALRAGLRIASGDIVLFISGDAQENPDCLKEMIEKQRHGANVVWALRKNRKDEPWHIKVPARLFYNLQEWFNKDKSNPIDLYRADFYLLDRKVVNAINSCGEKNTSIFGLIAWLGFRQEFVEYERRRRKYGRSKWSFSSRVKLALDWIVAFSGLPLRMISFTGILVASLGLIYAVVIIINGLRGRLVQGWASTMAAILVLGGVQMIMLGVIGEYLWRNIEESRGRPLYFIEKANFKFDNQRNP